MKIYKLFIRKYNIIKNDYETIEQIIETNDIYHEIGKIYCTTLDHIKRIDYYEIKDTFTIKEIMNEIEDYLNNGNCSNDLLMIFNNFANRIREEN